MKRSRCVAVLLLVDRSDIGVRGGIFGKSRMVWACRFRDAFDSMAGLGCTLDGEMLGYRVALSCQDDVNISCQVMYFPILSFLATAHLTYFIYQK